MLLPAADQPVARHADVEQSDAPAAAHDPAELVEERAAARRGCAGRNRTSPRRRSASGSGRRRMSACARGAPLRSAASMPKLRSNDSGRWPARVEVDAQVAGAAGEVDHRAARRQGEQLHGLAPPAHVEAERHDPVDEVVPRGDGVEHLPNGCDLVVALRQRLAVPRSLAHALEAIPPPPTTRQVTNPPLLPENS